MLIALLAVFAGCDRSEGEPDITPPSPVREAPRVELVVRVAAADVIEKFECNRCHEVPQTPPAVRDKHCFTCHQQIHDGSFDAKPETLVKWRGRIQSLRHAPSLAQADRLQRAWVKRFLIDPHDVRPGSIAEMPRLAISDAEADRLATFLVPTDDRSPLESTPTLVARGERLYRSLACARCHRFTGAGVDDAAAHASGRIGDERSLIPRLDDAAARASGLAADSNAGGPSDDNANARSVRDESNSRPANTTQIEALAIAWRLAPDLRFARDRVQPAQLAAWIEAPRGAMPKLAISRDDARALAAFIAMTPLAAQPRDKLAPKRLPILEREVAWAEVSAKVFHDTCWHCHAVPDFARGDGGPGNSGGFGFVSRGLDLSSYTGISQGSLDATGERRSVFEKVPNGTSRVVAHLMARHVEAAGGTVDGIRGMPLGLPALSLEQIQLVESWIAQGRPQ